MPGLIKQNIVLRSQEERRGLSLAGRKESFGIYLIYMYTYNIIYVPNPKFATKLGLPEARLFCTERALY